MNCLIENFKTDMINVLKKTYSGGGLSVFVVAIFAHFNRLDLLKIIYSQTDELNEINNVVDTAAVFGHLEMVKYLTEMGASCSTNAMDWAARDGHLDIVKWLHFNRSESGKSALYYAAVSGHFEIVKYLFENGVGVDRINGAIRDARLFSRKEIAAYLESKL